jgi:GTP cyclohydrolase II
VICEIMNDDGTMARMPDLEVFAKKHGLLILSVADLIQYRTEASQGVLLYMYPHNQTPEDAVRAALAGRPASSRGEVKLSAIDAKQVNTVNPEFRDFGVGAQILSSLGVGRLRLLTDHPRRIVGLEAYGLHLTGCTPISPKA